MAKLTRKQLAEAVNVSVETIINWEERGIIPFLEIGHVVRFDLIKVEKALSKFERLAAK
jgi:excisionase family DNA binding protein